MKKLIPVLVLALVIVPCLGLAEGDYSKEFVVSFDDYKVMYIDSNITRIYSLGKILGNAKIVWKGSGNGVAYIVEDGVTKKIIDLSTDGSTTVALSGGDVVIMLDSNALWRGRITIIVRDVYRISVRLSRTSLTLQPGSSAEVTMSIRRVSGFDRYVTLQYHVSDEISVNINPSPPWLVGSQQVTLSIEASSSAHGTYIMNMWIVAYRDPNTHPPIPIIPPPRIPVPIPTFDQRHWILVGELSLNLNLSNIGSDIGQVASIGSTQQITIVLLVLLVAIIIVIIMRGGRKR